MTNSLFVTEDGSHSLISGKFGEAYHSRHGAIQESRHVFINAGLEYILQQKKEAINILEIGFGTGLNALMTLAHLNHVITKSIKCRYDGIEAYPITYHQAQQLNYCNTVGLSKLKTSFLKMHLQTELHYSNSLLDFQVSVHETKFEEYGYPTELYDLVYFDAFAPSSQAHLWEIDLHDLIYRSLKTSGVLVTYCAKGSFKRTLKSIGYTLESLPGPGKKREMTRAVK